MGDENLARKIDILEVAGCKVRIQAAGLLAGLCLSIGPGTVLADPATSSLTPGEGQAVIFIQRTGDGLGFAQREAFFVDGVKIAVLNFGQCTQMLVPAGPHSLGADQLILFAFTLSKPALSGPVVWQSGGHYFYRFEVRTVSGLTAETSLREIDPDEGHAAAVGCHFSAPINTEKLVLPPAPALRPPLEKSSSAAP